MWQVLLFKAMRGVMAISSAWSSRHRIGRRTRISWAICSACGCCHWVVDPAGGNPSENNASQHKHAYSRLVYRVSCIFGFSC